MTNSEIDDALMDVMESRIGLQHDFAPSVCIADAWRVIGWMRDRLPDSDFKLTWACEAESDAWYAAFDEGGRIRAGTAETAPRAICLAALSTLEAGKKGKG